MRANIRSASTIWTVMLWVPIAGCGVPPVDAQSLASPLSSDERLRAPSGVSGLGNFGTLTVPGRGGGEALSIRSIEVTVEVRGRMARTEVRQLFHNHLPRQTEGTYCFTLPDGAAISRLAMDVEGTLVEGELVEKARAREIYDDIVRRMKDPALLEWKGGNRFETSIFPIPARGDKLVILGYEQLLPQYRDAFTYRYSLPNLKGQAAGSLVHDFSFALRAQGAGEIIARGYAMEVQREALGGVVTLQRRSFVPSGPIEVEFAYAARAGIAVDVAAVDGERFFGVDYVPTLPADDVDEPPALVVALDTSASIGAVELGRARALVLNVLDQLPDGHPVSIVHGDYAVGSCAAVAGEWLDPDSARRCLEALTPGGGTDLEALVARAIEVANAAAAPAAVVLLSDGVATLGALDADILQAHLVAPLADRPISLHTVAVGHAPDRDFLAGLASQGRGHFLRLTPARSVSSVASRLVDLVGTPLLTGVTVSVTSGTVDGLHPQRPVNLARGEALYVLGRLGSESAVLSIAGEFRGEPVEEEVILEAAHADGGGLLRNFWARRLLGEMRAKGSPRERVVQTSLRYGVMSHLTSFLVLENDAAFKRNRIEQRKKHARTRAEQAAQSASSTTNLRKGNKSGAKGILGALGAAKAGEGGDSSLFGAGGLGTGIVMGDSLSGTLGIRGRGPGGGGSSTTMFGASNIGTRGRGGGGSKPGVARSRRPVVISQGTPVVMGSLDREIIGRIIRENIAQVRYCYERELARSPDIHGKVLVKFVIAANGRVANATVAETTLGSAAVESCICNKVRRWRFPSPGGGGIVIVNYPFVFRRVGAEGQGETLQEQRREHEREVSRAERRLVDSRSEADGLCSQLSYLWSLDPEAVRRVVPRIVADGLYSPEEMYRALTCRPELTRMFPLEVYRLAQQQLRSPAFHQEALQHYFHATGEVRRAGLSALTSLISRCAEHRLDLEQCAAEHGAGADRAASKALLVKAVGESLAEVVRARQQDIGNIELIQQHAALLQLVAGPRAARRLLSEMVEFSPHDHATRVRYAQLLASWGDVAASCRHYASATQLDPAQREVFRSLMELRRAHPEEAEEIRRCVVDGVSNLPVQRDISLVLTWEDPHADVDLRVREPGGEEVFFGHQESAAGGLLYYDITDGYGPEIYALGSAQPGRHKISLVYYDGTAKRVRGTLTILRHAGTPRESREDHPFVLVGPSSTLKVPVADITL